MRGAQAIAGILKREGTEKLFCFPNNPLIDAGAELGIEPVVARTERTVIGMAEGYTRVTNGRKTGVAAVQYGPGVENAFGGMAQAYSDSTPILFVPAGMRLDRLGSEPGFDAVKNFQFVTKWAARINRPDRIPEFMRRAFTFLRAGRPGPVLLELPMDVATAEVDEDALAYHTVKGVKTAGDPASVREVARALVGARTPLIHAGMGILYAEAWNELRELAELLQAPVMTTLQGKSAFPEDHPLSLGSGGRAAPLPVARYLAESDLIFGAGSALAISDYDAPIPTGKLAVQLTVDERDLNRDYISDMLLMGDARLVLRQLIEEVQRELGPEGRRGDERTARQIAGIRHEWLSEWMPKLTSNETPINPYRVIWDLQQAVVLRNTIATHDAGSPRDQMTPFWKALEPNSYLGWGKSTHLGYGIPLVLGAKVAKPEKTVLNIMGDLAFGMSGLEIETASRYGLGTITVVFRNGVMGDYYKHMPKASDLYGARNITGDYCKIGEGLGAYTERVERPDEIIPAARRAVKVAGDGRPVLLEIVTREETTFSRYW